MRRLASFFTQNWFSLSIVTLISLSLVKKYDLQEAPLEFRNTTIVQSAVQTNTIVANSTPINSSARQQPTLVSNVNPVAKTKLVEPISAIENQAHKKFIRRFSKVAINEMEKYGIPASITLAHALVESDGLTENHDQGNNFFNTPCYKKDCSQDYKTAWLSFRAHSIHLTTGPYKYLQRIPVSNLSEWAKSIQSIGYSNQPTYDERLLDIIDLYQLNKLDVMSEKA